MRRLLATLALIAIAPLLAAAGTPSSSLLPPRVEKAITDRIAVGEYPAIVVAVVDGERGHVYGFGKLANGDAPNADTMFQIGSITKTFTAALLAQAVQDGSVKLDTPVSKLLPGFTIPSRNGKSITLGELASQVSGLPRMPTNMTPANPADPYADYDAAKLKEFLANYTLPRDPGSKYEYSNLGFGLLGYALAQHAGTTYAELVREGIFKPLGMSSSRTSFKQPLGSRWAQGHDDIGKLAQPWHLDALAGAGAINSSGADMLRYLEANMGRGQGGLRKAMQFAQQSRRPVGDERIGLAWMTRHAKNSDVIWHNGMTGGYASFMGFTSDGQHGVVILTNIAQPVDDLGFAMLLPNAPLAPTLKAIAMTPQQMEDYVGEYRLAPGFVVTVFRDGDQLSARATGQNAFPIYPNAADKFFARVADIRIDFQRGKNGGKVTSLVLHQNGHDSPAPKLDSAAIEKANGHHAVHLDAATLQQYVGHYQLAPGATFDITLRDGQLHVQLTGQPSFPVYPSAKDEFYYTVVDAQLSFKRDATGKVDALVLHQNGADQRAPRMP